MFGRKATTLAPDRRPLILIGIPCYGDVPPEVYEDGLRFAYHLGRRLPQYDFLLAIRTKSEQFRARNCIVEEAIKRNTDYVLMLDDDMIINTEGTLGPTAAYGFVEQLIAHNKPIIGALYYQKVGACAPVLMTATSDRGYRFLHERELVHGLQQVDVAGGGCLLIKTTVFDHLPPQPFAPEFEFGTDVQLCRLAKAQGFEVWADTSIEIGHLKNTRAIVTHRNRHQHQLEEQFPAEVKRTFVATEAFQSLVADACEWTGYHDMAEMKVYAQAFHDAWADHHQSGASDVDWYRRFPKERVARQVWFNLDIAHKRTMTEFILNSVNHTERLRILDFGCGIGIPAFTFAQKGHEVLAVDIAGTGTFEFLQWRVKKHGLEMAFGESGGGIYGLGSRQFDVIVAMDCLEHLPEWRRMLEELAAHLVPGGALFCNNAILDDQTHVEHYPLTPRDFKKAVIDVDLDRVNEITYFKRAEMAAPVHA